MSSWDDVVGTCILGPVVSTINALKYANIAESYKMSDPFSFLMDSLRLRARILYIGGVCGPWRMDITAPGLASFHMVVRGQAWLTSEISPHPRLLQPGDLVLYPRDLPHGLTAAPEGCDVVDASLRVGTGEGDTDLLCGTIELAEGHDHPLVLALPPEIVLPAEGLAPGLSALVGLMQQEASLGAAGRDAVVARLAETLFVLAARECMQQPDAAGALAGLSEPRLRKAMTVIHEHPQTPWTLQLLAQVAGMSRTAFAETFSRRVGVTAMDYLLHWRMRVAAGLLRDEGLSVEVVAARVGYESVASFIRAFSRVHGLTPGRFVRRALAASRLLPPTSPDLHSDRHP